MGYRTFNDNTTFDDAQSSTLYTAEALDAHPEPAVGKLAAEINEQLDEVDALEAMRRKARRATIRASARTRAAAAWADDELGELSKDMLGAVRQDRSAALYTAIFRVPPADIKAMSIGPKLEEIARIRDVLEAKSTPAELRKAWMKRVTDVASRAASALGERKTAAALTADADAKIAEWTGEVDRARRKVDGTLTTYAADRDLDRDFNVRFFPPPPPAAKTKKNGKKKQEEVEPDGVVPVGE